MIDIREYIILLHQEWHQNGACQPRSSTHGESLSTGVQERMRTARSKKLLGRIVRRQRLLMCLF